MRLVIGYGNPLRGDDGVGPVVTDLVAARRPDLRTLVVPLLVPELAPEIAAAAVVVFVDARRGTTPGTVVSETLTAAAAMSAFGHRLGPAALLALTVGLYGRCAQAFQVTIAGSRFDFGAALSPAIAAAIPAAADAVLAIVGDHPTSGGPSTSGTAGTPIPSPALPTS